MTAAPMLLAAFGAARRIRPYPTSDWSTAGNDFEGKNLRMITVFIYIYVYKLIGSFGFLMFEPYPLPKLEA